MREKFKKKSLELDDEDPYFRKLPLTRMMNINEHIFFTNFIQSDLQIEVMRATKLKVFMDHIKTFIKPESSLLIPLREWLCEEILH